MTYPPLSTTYRLTSITYILGGISAYRPPRGTRAIIVKPGTITEWPTRPSYVSDPDVGWGGMVAFGFGHRRGSSSVLFRRGKIRQRLVAELIAQSTGSGGLGITIVWEFR